MWLIFGIIYLSIGVAYVMYDWYSDKKGAYISTKRNGEADDAGLIVYWLLSLVFWPIILILPKIAEKDAKSLVSHMNQP